MALRHRAVGALAAVVGMLAGGVSLSTPAVAATLAADTFNRADAATLGTSSSGHAWVVHAGSVGVRGQQAAPGPGYALASLPAGATEHVTAVTVARTGPEFWLLVRFQDKDNYWRFGRRSNGPYVLQQVRGNALAEPAVRTTASPTPEAGDRLACTTTAGGLSCRVDGAPVAHAADPTGATAPGVGLASYFSEDVRFDDLAVTAAPAGPDLVTTLSGDTSTVAGEPFSVTARVVNTGMGSAPSTALTVTAPAGATSTSARVGATPCPAVSGGYRCDLGSLGPAGSAEVTFAATAPATGGIARTVASATSGAADTNPASDTDAWETTVVAPLPDGTVAFDDFQRADATALGSAPTGQPWRQHYGGFSVSGGRAAPSTGYALTSLDSGLGEYVVSATLAASGSELWLVSRLSDGANYWRFGRVAGGPYVLQQVRANGLGNPALEPVTALTPEAGDRVECRSSSTSLSCSVDGVAVVRTRDGFNALARGAGLGAWESTGVRFDDVRVQRIPAQPDLVTTLTGDSTIPASGTATVTATVRNAGRAAMPSAVATVDVTGAAAASAQYAGAACPASPTPRCNLGNLAAGASATVTVTLTAPATRGSMTTTVTASGGAADAYLPDDRAAHLTSVHLPPPPNALVYDEFARADAATLGTTMTGQAWTTHAGGFAIVTQEASASAGYALASVDAGAADQVTSVAVPAPGSEFWLVMRLQDAGSYWRFGRYNGGPYTLQRVLNNGLASPAVSVLKTLQAEPGDRLECQSSAAGLACSVDGTVVARSSDTGGATATRAGLATWASPGTRYDDFLVTRPAPQHDLVTTVTGTTAVATGASVSLTGTVTNAGTKSASGATVTVVVPAGLRSVAVTTSAGTCTGTGTVTCAVGTMASGTAVTVRLTATAPDQATTLGVVFRAAPTDGDANASDNEATVSLRVRAPVAPGTKRLEDNFDRADTTTGLGSAPSGEPWVVHRGGFRISGGRARPTSAAFGVASIDPAFPFGTYELTWPATGGPFWATFRVVDADNYYRFGSANGTDAYRLEKIVNGTPQPLYASFRRNEVTPAPGDVIRIALRPDDGIFIAVNGRHVVDAGDQQFMYESAFGFASASAAPAVDDVFISSVISSYEVLDSFGRADSTSGMGTPESGVSYPWTSWVGSGWGITGGKAYNASGDYGVVFLDTSSEAARTSVKVTATAEEYGIAFRFSEDGTFYRFGVFGDGRFGVDLVRGYYSSEAVAGVTQHAAVTPAPGQVLTVELGLDGTVTTYVDGVRTHSFKETTVNPRGGHYGLFTYGSAARFDDVRITPQPL